MSDLWEHTSMQFESQYNVFDYMEISQLNVPFVYDFKCCIPQNITPLYFSYDY